jgi:outer membrane usher protein
MSRLRPPALERLLALAAAIFAALGGNPAHAQSDPFALDTGITAQSVAAERRGPGLTEIAVDGETRARMVNLTWRDDVLLIAADGARAAGLPIPDSASGEIPLDSLRIVKWRFDSVRQRLEIDLFRNSDGSNLIDLTKADHATGESAPLTALRLDYDLSATLANGHASAAGFFDATLVRGNVALNSSFQLVSEAVPGSSSAIRLDTQAQILFPRRGIVATLGDFVSAGGQSQRALRLGGLQIASDYALRPDLVINPLPSFTGQVAIPTGVDLISADQRFSLGEVQPGEFTVRNVPASAGRGEVSVVMRDALGREVVQNTRFYVARNLLAPGLTEFAVNAGFVRRRYGLRSNDYGSLAASAYFRRGISPRFTVEGTAEWTASLVNGGVRGDLVLGSVALTTLELRYSHDSIERQSGSLVHIGIESVGRGLSGRIAAILPSSGYRDVASRLGDPPPPREFLGQISFDLARATHLQITASRQDRRSSARLGNYEPRVDTINASLRSRLARNIDVFASAGYRNGTQRAYTGWIGISVQLGRGTAQASAAGGTGSPVRFSGGYSRHESPDRPFGYAIEAMSGSSPRIAGSATWRSTFARMEGQVENVGGAFGLRANARGTLLLAGGTLFARNQTGGSFALVRTGKVDGVTVLRENRSAGVTAHGGVLLVDNIPAQVPLSFDIDPDKLPATAMARATHRRIQVPRRAVGLVALDVVRFVPRPIRIIGIDGAPLAAGSIVVAHPSGERSMVGFDGVIDFNAAGGDRWVSLVRGDEAQCFAEIASVTLAAIAADAAYPEAACQLGAPEALTRLEGQGRRPSGSRRR